MRGGNFKVNSDRFEAILSEEYTHDIHPGVKKSEVTIKFYEIVMEFTLIQSLWALI